MTYELAEKLKDAGFPQTCKKQYSFLEGPQAYSLQNKGDLYYVCDAPDLEELIDACGDKFWSIQYFPKMKDKWGAYAREIKYDSYGETLLEAVAKLYIKLNK